MMTHKEGIYIKEYAIDITKVSGIVCKGVKIGLIISFTSYSENCIHI
jgi:hypothetical protein